ncbi:MAG: substrate-binding domain-containing protein [Verrucomicrobia bacterium]|jgi:LacI family transcriptional regulator|nr:substrate-binding domain-containing protein [Verrucomicrobiota bacterium]
MSKSNRSYRVALVCEKEAGWFLGQAFQGIIRWTHANASWELVTHQGNPFIPAEIAANLSIDGALGQISGKMEAKLSAAGIRSINLFYDYHEEALSVVADAQAAGEEAATFFLGRGFKNVAVVDYPYAPLFVDRAEAFVARVGRAGLTAAVIPISMCQDSSGQLSFEVQLPDEIHPEAENPIGILALDDRLAVVLEDLMRERGISVPESVAILGIHNIPYLCELREPMLSSVDIDPERVGIAAAGQLDSMLNDKPTPSKNIYVAPQGIVERQSTDTCATDDAHVRQALRFIREHATEGIRVPDIMRSIPLSRRSMEYRFRRSLGRSILSEIQRIRLQRASMLLEKTDKAIPDVARDSGFSSQTGFITAFRHRYSRSPSEHRARYHSAADESAV